MVESLLLPFLLGRVKIVCWIPMAPRWSFMREETITKAIPPERLAIESPAG